MHDIRIVSGRNAPARTRKTALVGTTAIMMGLLGAASVGGAAHAQEAGGQGGAAVQEVVVTGSRIARRDFTSNSPIVTVNAASFENTANVALEATLNKLPQFVADQNMTGEANSGDVQPTATHTVGISTASLRGLGPNRNLVLVDGHRQQPVNGELVVDLNSIPSAAIDRVEVITGGASAVYGADAVAGVVNFILKKDFQGVDLDTQYGITQAGDGQEFKISALLGANFADDKGNVMFGVEHFTRDASWQKNRDFYRKGFADPTVANNEFFFTGAAYNVDSPVNTPNQAVVDALFSGRPAGTSVPAFTAFYFNTDGTVFTGASGAFGGGGAAGSYRYKGQVNGYDVAPATVVDPYSGYTVQTALKTNQTNYYVTAPANRWSTYGRARYDFNDDLSLSVNGNFEQTKTHTILFPSPFINGWGVSIPYDADHPVSPELATLLNSRPDPTAPWSLYLIPDPSAWMPPRSTDDTNTVWQISAALDGKVPGTDFTWELYGSHGQSSSYTVGLGYASLTRYEDLISQPDYGANATLTGNQVNGGFGAAQVHCTSGFYDVIFHGAAPSQDCINAISAKLQNQTFVGQNVVEFNTQGGLFNTWAGQVRGSLGASYRDDSIQYNPDVLQSTVSFRDQVVGVYPAAYMDALTSAREGYGELLIPIANDLTFVKHFDLELGARYSTYTAADHVNNVKVDPEGGWTYKILGDWQVNDWLRFRGGYNLAVRAPNIGELFLGKQEVFGGPTNYGDPCSRLATAPFGANPATNSSGAAGAANTEAICRALMGPAGAAYYYANPQIPGAFSPFGFVNQMGNPNLKPERARTWTAGVVLRSPIQSGWLSRFNASIDWYKISITGAIEFDSVDNVKQACLTLPAAQAIGSFQCSLLARNPILGQEDTTTIVYNNLATIWTSGVDGQLNWGADLSDIGFKNAPGAVNLSVLVNWLDYFDTQSTPGGPTTHWAGTLGPNLAGTDAGAFKYKLNTTLSYAVGPASLSLNWRHLPSIHAQSYGQPGDRGVDTASHDEFGLSGTWTINKNYILRAGVENLFNAEPEITAQTVTTGTPGTPDYQLASSGAGTTNEGLYDALGRRFYVGLKAKF